MPGGQGCHAAHCQNHCHAGAPPAISVAVASFIGGYDCIYKYRKKLTDEPFRNLI